MARRQQQPVARAHSPPPGYFWKTPAADLQTLNDILPPHRLASGSPRAAVASSSVYGKTSHRDPASWSSSMPVVTSLNSSEPPSPSPLSPKPIGTSPALQQRQQQQLQQLQQLQQQLSQGQQLHRPHASPERKPLVPPIMGDRTQRFEGLSHSDAARSLQKAEARSPGLASLRALEHYAHEEVSRLPLNSVERTAAYRHIFNQLIATLPAHGPLLTEIKRHYERELDAANAAAAAAASRRTVQATPPAATMPADACTPQSPSSPPKSPSSPFSPRAQPGSIGLTTASLSLSPSHGAGGRAATVLAAENTAAVLRATHPLQYPASYYESQWRATQWEVELRTREVQRLEASQEVLELRLAGLSRLNESLSKSSVASRCMAEEIIEEAKQMTRSASMNPAFVALELAKAAAAGVPPSVEVQGAQDLGSKASDNEKSLLALVKMLRRQELHVADAARLLEQHIDWEDPRGVDSLRQLVASI